MKDSAKNKSTLKKVMETPFAFNLIWAVIVTIVLISLVLLWLNIYTRHNEAEVVPNVKGMTVAEAEKFFDDNNLRYSVIDSVFSKDVKPGSIVEIIPEAGSKVKEGRIVFVTVNAASAQMAVIPEVWEISVRQADAMKLSLKPSVSVLRKSSNWLTKDRSRDTFLSIRLRDFCTFSSSLFESISFSRGFLMSVSGVRISCAILMKKSIFA